MGFDFSTMLTMVWKHPLLCGSVLLLLTPSLFHVVLYFSPLLISTALFIVALISMGPRFEETQQEREKWAKGEKPSELVDDVNWPYTDWSQPDITIEPVAAAKRARAPEDGSSWLELLDDARSKLATWIDNVYKASSEQSKPLVPEPAPAPAPTIVEEKQRKPVPEDDTGHATIQVRKLVEPEAPEPVEPVEDIKTVDVGASSTPAPSAPAPEPPAPVEDVKIVSERELDMPELEIVELPQAELAASEMVAAGVLAEKKLSPETEITPDDQPIWDEPHELSPEKLDLDLRAPLKDEDLMEVPLNDPVQELVHKKPEVRSSPRKELGSKKESSGSSPRELGSKQELSGSSPRKELGSKQELSASSPRKELGSKSSPTPAPKHVRFRSESAIGTPPPVREAILKNLYNQLEELQEKKRDKYTQILSRRMSSKNGSKAALS